MRVLRVVKKTGLAENPSVRLLITDICQSLMSLSANIGGILAGTLLTLYFDTFSLSPWTLILFPGILSMRGAISGLFSARMSTGLHLGTVRTSYTKNAKGFYLLLYATITLAFESCIILGLSTSLISIIIWGTSILDTINILAVTTATVGLSLLFMSPITVGFSFLSFRHGLDPDIIVYPTTATIADIIITACYVLVLNLFFSLTRGRFIIWTLNLVFLSIVLFILIFNVREEEFSKTIKEFFLTLISVVLIVNITGSVLHELSEVIGARLEIYTVYPALIDTVGGVGSIVGSTATTKLALGIVKTNFSSIKQHLTMIISAWMASVTMFTIYSVMSSFIHGLSFHDLLRLIAQLLTTNVIAISVTVVIAYVVAIFTYRRGWDPDNFVIPIESALADSIATISLFLMLNVI